MERRGGSCRLGLREKDFKRFAAFIHDECGIKMPPTKRTMLEARLQKRLRVLGLADYAEYCEFVFSPEGMETELHHLLDVVTTNTTDFFREPKHFETLANVLLPQWSAATGNRREYRVWSAGCSTGEEPYTLAMVLSDYAESSEGFDFKVLATDISTRVLQHAAKAVYTVDKVSKVPQRLKSRYLLRSKDRTKQLVRMVPEVRRRVIFRRLNFMGDFKLKKPRDAIFCRNVMIYFERPTQEKLLGKLCDNLIQGGHLFIGHSESLTGLDLPLEQVAPTVYRRV
nr:protein-glutamate O-methyltransferase [Desulfohalovibrio reitneri]